MDKSIVYFPVKISGVLGKITPEIKVTIRQGVLFSIMKGAAKKAVREELKRHDAQLAQTATTPTTALDMSGVIDPALPPDSVRMSQDVLCNLIRRRAILDLLDDIPKRIADGDITTLDDVREYLESLIA